MNPAITLYSKNRCQPCVATKRKLADLGLDFVEVNLDTDPRGPAILDELIAEGWRESPIVRLGNGETWSGFRPDLLAKLA